MKTRSSRSQAAITNLLDAIKSTGIKPLDETQIEKRFHHDETSGADKTNKKELINNLDTNSIPYTVKLVNPNDCVLWKFANRLDNYINEESCVDLIENIKLTGQKIPALGRITPSGKIELIYGARRRFACIYLNQPLLVAIANLDDKEALLAMDAENRPRSDISPYERALDYKRWLDERVYKSYSEIGQAIGMKKSLFSKLMALAELDESIIQAFKHPANLTLHWGYELYKICNKNSESKKKIITLAKDLVHLNLQPSIIYKRFKEAVRITSSKKQNETEWLVSKSNTNLFGIKKEKSGQVQFVFDTSVPKHIIDEIQLRTIDLIKSNVN